MKKIKIMLLALVLALMLPNFKSAYADEFDKEFTTQVTATFVGGEIELSANDVELPSFSIGEYIKPTVIDDLITVNDSTFGKGWDLYSSMTNFEKNKDSIQLSLKLGSGELKKINKEMTQVSSGASSMSPTVIRGAITPELMENAQLGQFSFDLEWTIVPKI